MNKFSNSVCVIGLLAFGVAVVQAADKPVPQGQSQVLVVAKPAMKRGGTLVSVEYYSSGAEVGVNVDLELGTLEKGGLDLAGCANSSLKAGAGWAGGCSMVDGVVRFVVVNTSLQPLPKGWHTLGTFRTKNVPQGGITAKVVAAGDANSQSLPVSYEFSWVE